MSRSTSKDWDRKDYYGLGSPTGMATSTFTQLLNSDFFSSSSFNVVLWFLWPLSTMFTMSRSTSKDWDRKDYYGLGSPTGMATSTFTQLLNSDFFSSSSFNVVLWFLWPLSTMFTMSRSTSKDWDRKDYYGLGSPTGMATSTFTQLLNSDFFSSSSFNVVLWFLWPLSTMFTMSRSTSKDWDRKDYYGLGSPTGMATSTFTQLLNSDFFSSSSFNVVLWFLWPLSTMFTMSRSTSKDWDRKDYYGLGSPTGMATSTFTQLLNSDFFSSSSFNVVLWFLWPLSTMFTMSRSTSKDWDRKDYYGLGSPTGMATSTFTQLLRSTLDLHIRMYICM